MSYSGRDETRLRASANKQGRRDGTRNRKNQPPIWIKSFFRCAREKLEFSYREGYILGKEDKSKNDD